MLPGISTEQLRSRLNRMVADGLLTRQRYREVPPRVDYELTERSRELMPVLGALARWGYDWTWSAPRPGEDINVGAVLRLAPGLLAPSRATGTVDAVVLEDGGERVHRLWLAAAGVEVSAGQPDDPPADARIEGTVEAWVDAFGPDGITSGLAIEGSHALAETVLDGFVAAAERTSSAAAA